MTSHEKRVNALMRFHGMTKAQAERRARELEGVKRNPSPAPKRKYKATTKRSAAAYVHRVSQATGKKPTKRLVKRRTKNLQVPRGVFPNPAPKKAPGFRVEVMNVKTGNWKRIATFETAKDAKEYANAYHRARQYVAVRVVQ